MKSMKKALLIVLCAALLVTASVMGTMAYLTSTDSVTNTFTVGKVTITMDETKVNEYGDEVENAEPVETNQYKLIPGHEYTKDPTIHVAKESEPCWLFVKIENGLAGATITGLDYSKWTVLESNVYYYNTKVDARETQVDVPVFTGFTYAENVTDTSDDATKSIVVTAYAVQADGFDTAIEAWSTSKVGESTSGN